MQQDRGFRPRFAPVKIGDELDVKIEAVGEKGDGIAKKDGFVLFVPNTKEGQEVKIRITKVLRKVGFAEVIGEGAPQEKEPAEATEEESEQVEEEPAAEESEEQEVEDTEDFGEEEK
jgi:predicted RNA-binding protein with TRAM domain